MVRNLRRRHLQIWTALAILIPTGIVSAIIVRPRLPKDKLLQPTASAALPVILKSVDKDDYTINLRSNTDTSQLQLEWINKKSLTYPTATIYEATSPNSFNVEASQSLLQQNAKLIGRIEARGIYRFAFKDRGILSSRLILYDFIHKRIIEIITF